MAAALLERAARWLSVRLKINVERPRRRAANDVRAVWRRPAGASMRIICTIYSLDRTSLSDRHVSTWEGDNASPGGGLALTGRDVLFSWSITIFSGLCILHPLSANTHNTHNDRLSFHQRAGVLWNLCPPTSVPALIQLQRLAKGNQPTGRHRVSMQ